MTYSFQDATVLADANRRLALDWSQVIRNAAERQVRLGADIMEKAGVPGGGDGGTAINSTVPAAIAAVFAAIDRNRNETIEEAKLACKTWCDSVGQVCSPDTFQASFATTMETLSRFSGTYFDLLADIAAAKNTPRN